MQPSFDVLTSRPALWIPGMNDEEWDNEVEQMLAVSIGKHLLNQGKISFDQYEDILNENGLNPIDTIEDWTSGLFYY